MPKLLMTVEEMKEREKWLAHRNLGLGGSDAAIVVGLNKWKAPFQLWLEKTEQTEPEDLSDNEYIHWGNVLEEVVAKEFCERTGKKVRRQGLVQSDEHPFMLASVDRMVVGENAGLECKTANGFAAKMWDGDEVPDSYYVQCQHYMAVTGCERWYIACLIGGNHFVWKEIPRNEDDIKALIEAEEKFWSFVLTKTMPPVDGSAIEVLGERFHGGSKEAIILPSDALEIVNRYIDIGEQIKTLESAQNDLKAKLMNMMGDNEVGMSGDYKVTWATRKGRTTLDTKAFQKDHPDLYSKYIKTGKDYRVFAIK